MKKEIDAAWAPEQRGTQQDARQHLANNLWLADLPEHMSHYS